MNFFTDVVNNGSLDTEKSKVENHKSYVEKDYNEFKKRNDKESEDFLIERVVKTTTQILYDEGIIDIFDNPEEILKHHFFVQRIRSDLELKLTQKMMMTFKEFIHESNFKNEATSKR